MKLKVTIRHKHIADSLTERLLAELQDQVHSIVLFGSVARGEATDESDIDILVIAEIPFAIERRMESIANDIGLDNEVFIQLVFFTTEKFEDQVFKYRSYLSSDIIDQGIILYDDGTYRRICETAASVVPGVSGR
jgi:predicted nucleotidyltransferase